MEVGLLLLADVLISQPEKRLVSNTTARAALVSTLPSFISLIVGLINEAGNQLTAANFGAIYLEIP